MADSEKNWYVLRAVSGKEQKVKEYIEAEMKHNPTLASRVFQVLIPMEKHASMRGNKRVVREKNFLPGYVLLEANLTSEIAPVIRFMPNVLGFLGGMDKPSPVKQSDINRLLGTAEETIIEGGDMEVPYIVGDKVKVNDGPFSSFDGTIEEVNTEKKTLKVTVKIFGRNTPLELSFTQVTKIG
jgi:transcriptional antiterminator NusG